MKLDMPTPISFYFELGAKSIKKLRKILRVSNAPTNWHVGVLYSKKHISKFLKDFHLPLKSCGVNARKTK